MSPISHSCGSVTPTMTIAMVKQSSSMSVIVNGICLLIGPEGSASEDECTLTLFGLIQYITYHIVQKFWQGRTWRIVYHSTQPNLSLFFVKSSTTG